MSQKAMIDGFYTKLTADQSAGSFYDDLGGRIAFGQAEENTTRPHCVFSVVADPPDMYLADDNIDADIQVDLYGDRKAGISAIEAINAKLFTLLQRQALTISGRDWARCECEDKGLTGIDDDSFRITSRWRVLAG